MRTPSLAALLGLASLFAAVPEALAAPLDGLGRPAVVVPVFADVEEPLVRIRVSADFAFPCDLDGNRGHTSRQREWLRFEVRRPVDARFTFRFDAEFEHDSYQFDRPDAIVPGPGRLLEDAFRVWVRPGFDLRLDADWQIGGDIAVTLAGVPEADMGRATTIGGSFTVRRRFSAGFGLRVGVLVVANLEDEPLIVPILIPDDGDQISTSRFRFEFRGPAVRAGYALSSAVTAGVTAAYDRRDWRLSKDDRVPDGILRDLSVPVGLFVEFSPKPNLTIGLEAGANVYQEFEFVDRSGRRVTIFEAEPAPRAGLSLAWRF